MSFSDTFKKDVVRPRNRVGGGSVICLATSVRVDARVDAKPSRVAPPSASLRLWTAQDGVQKARSP